MLPIFHALLVREKVTNRHSEALRAEKMPIENKKQNTSGNASLITHYVPHDSHNALKSLYKAQVADAAATLLKRTYSLINLFSYSLRKRAAFTLAEVLITLGIIGVVAAMTMPSLITNYKYKVLENQLKAAYSDLNQAAKMFQVHNDMSVSEYAASEGSIKAQKEFSKEFNSVLKNSDKVYGSTDSDGNILLGSAYEWKDITGEKSPGPSCDFSGYFWDTQGRVIGFDNSPNLGENGPKVCIDINGQKAPNRYGLDYFVFMFTTDGYVIPWGQEHKDNPNCTNYYANCTVPKESYCEYKSNQTAQITCSNYAIANQHPKDSDKNYWHDFVRGR